MTKRIIVALCIVFGVFGLAWIYRTYSIEHQMGIYHKHISSFQKTSLEKVQEKLDAGDSFLLFIGLDSCTHCHEFAPKLEQASKSRKVQIVYVELSKKDNLSSAQKVALSRVMTSSNLPYLAWVSGKSIMVFPQKSDTSVSDIEQFIFDHVK